MLYRAFAAMLTPLLGGRVERHQIGPLDLRVRVFGNPEAEAWVLLHGLGSSAFGWLPALKELSTDGYVLMPELSSLGGTHAPHGGLNVVEASAAITHLIEHRLPNRRITLAGISLGGWISLRIALARPDLIDRLLLVACAGYLDQDWNRVTNLVTVESRKDAGEMLKALFRTPPLRFRWGRGFVSRAYRSRPVRHVLETLGPEDVFGPEDLAHVTQPTGLIWGDSDGLFPVEVARAIDAALPLSHLEVLDRCGHVVPWDCPISMNRALRSIRAWWRAGAGVSEALTEAAETTAAP